MEKKKKYIVAVVVAAVLVIAGTLIAAGMINKNMQSVLDATFTENSAKLLLSGAEPDVDLSGSGIKVESLSQAGKTDQLIIVAVKGTEATVSMHTKDSSGEWNEDIVSYGYVGRDGLGKGSEYKAETPVGTFSFIKAFGVKADPGCALGYTKLDDSHYWVSDPDSKYYNKFVSTKDTKVAWKNAEHLKEVGDPYNYCLALDYNLECVPGAGSAFFLHCDEGKPTSGCVSVPETVMEFIMKNVKPGCLIIIDDAKNLKK